jgi:glycosyltransferase involved in cell wall biosynthesis
MRVLLANHFPLEGSGSGIYTQNVARELVAKGHDALAITPAHTPQEGFPFEVRTILFSPEPRGATPGRLGFNFPCFTTHPLSNTTYADLSAQQRQAYVSAFESAIQDAVRDWHPEVIHAQHLWVTGYVAKGTSMPYVATAHGTDLMGFRKYPAWKSMALEGARGAAAVIAISQQVARDARDLYGLAEEQIQLVMNGFDQAIFRVMAVDRAAFFQRHDLPDSPDHVVSFVGKLTHFKGVDVLLEAASIYEPLLGNVLTLIVGAGELRPELEAQAARAQLRGVHFLGHQPQTEVAVVYNLAGVSVVPSRVEPFGLVAVEALACGTPVVATNEGGLPDFVDDRVGALVEVDDPQALAGAIVHELSTQAKASKGPYAAEYALAGFSWSTQVEKMLAIYAQALQAAREVNTNE